MAGTALEWAIYALFEGTTHHPLTRAQILVEGDADLGRNVVKLVGKDLPRLPVEGVVEANPSHTTVAEPCSKALRTEHHELPLIDRGCHSCRQHKVGQAMLDL